MVVHDTCITIQNKTQRIFVVYLSTEVRHDITEHLRNSINWLIPFIPEGSALLYILLFGPHCWDLVCNRGCFLSTGSNDCAVLHYRFTGEKEVDLMSTYVPETFRGRGVAAVLSQVRG